MDWEILKPVSFSISILKNSKKWRSKTINLRSLFGSLLLRKFTIAKMQKPYYNDTVKGEVSP